MYGRDRAGGGSSRSDIIVGPLDRKRINDALDKHLEKSSPSASRGFSTKDKDRLSIPSTSTAKSHLSKTNCSDGKLFELADLLIFGYYMLFV